MSCTVQGSIGGSPFSAILTPPPGTEDAVRAALAERGARPWQIDVAAPAIVAALAFGALLAGLHALQSLI